MKVLFLNHPEADYGGYFLYNGLCDVLGDENVIDWPPKLSYHGETHIYPSFYTDVRFDPSQPISHEWKEAMERGQGVTAPFPFAVSHQAHGKTYEEVMDMCRSNAFDLVVIESPRVGSITTLKNIKHNLRTDRIVLHDGEDYNDVRVDILIDIDVRVCLYLKRELITMPIGFGIKPFPFSSMIKPMPMVEKDIDIFCAVGATHRNREPIQQIVEDLGVQVDYERRDWHGYIDAIRRSKIAIAPRGFGQDTVRRWEIPNFDTMMICERLDLIEENSLIDGEHCAYYSSPDELREKLRWYLTHDEERRRIADQGRRFVQEHHTNAARASQMLRWVKEIT